MKLIQLNDKKTNVIRLVDIYWIKDLLSVVVLNKTYDYNLNLRYDSV